MAFISVTNTFVNGATSDAPEVNTNFSDIINGTSDGTKDLSMSAATLAGALTCNGNVTLGNGAADDLTINASLASTLPIKTTHTYDIGSATIGLRDIFLGSTGGAFTTQISGSNVAASKTVNFWGFDVTLPTADGVAGAIFETDGSGTAILNNRTSPSTIENYSITVDVNGASAMNVRLKGADGNDLSATNPCYATFRSTTLTSGAPVTYRITSNISLLIDSGATLGTTNAVESLVYIFLIDNAGTPELAVSRLPENEYQEATTLALSSGADTTGELYSETQRTSVPIMGIGFFISTQATAGAWATNPSVIYAGSITDIEHAIPLTIIAAGSSTGVSSTFAVGYFKVSPTGVWRMTGNMEIQQNSRSVFEVTIQGIVARQTGFQAVAMGCSNVNALLRSWIIENTGQLYGSTAGTGDDWYVSLDIELKSKPTNL